MQLNKRKKVVISRHEECWWNEIQKIEDSEKMPENHGSIQLSDSSEILSQNLSCNNQQRIELSRNIFVLVLMIL